MTIDSKFIAAWEKGGIAPLVLTPLTRSQAVSLRHKLYRARTAMRKTKHPSTHVADQGTISITPSMKPEDRGKGIWELIIFPAAQAIEEALVNAGLTEDDPPDLE